MDAAAYHSRVATLHPDVVVVGCRQGCEQINWNWKGIAILKNCKGIALHFFRIAIAFIGNRELGIGLCMAIKL